MPSPGGGDVFHFFRRTAMNFEERALSFPCRGNWLVGVASIPQRPRGRGVLVVVGGPQYRAGSHRQFTLLARSLAAEGIATMRFDYRGMGDSDGEARTFEAVDDDLGAALDQFMAAVPGLEDVVIWGLCDAASAALFYAGGDPRVSGLVLLNPWVRTAGGLAKATLKHYYRSRLTDPALWKKILGGSFNYAAAGKSLTRLVGSALGGANSPAASAAALPERMLAGMRRFKGKVLLITSGADLTAREFLDMAAASPHWQRLLAEPRVQRHTLAPADHTFSRRAWRDQVSAWTVEWVRSW